MHNEQKLPRHQPLVAVDRSGHTESLHYGSLVTIDPQGHTTREIGEPNAPMYPRSALKPLQALVMLQLGFSGTPHEIALAAASHSGEEIHLRTVQHMLENVGLTTNDLQNTPDLPIGTQAHKQAVIAQQAPTRIHQNCSGKHAAMLATCLANQWDTKTYLDPQHPLQLAIAQGIEDITGQPILDTAIDGCGAPLFLTTLTALAKGFAHIAITAHTNPNSHEATIFNAITQNPEYLAGTDRDTTAMMRAVPGLMCKDGAEAVHAGALADGTAFALKIADGNPRARTVATIGVLEGLGFDVSEVQEAYVPKVLGHGQPVGAMRTLF